MYNVIVGGWIAVALLLLLCGCGCVVVVIICNWGSGYIMWSVLLYEMLVEVCIYVCMRML